MAFPITRARWLAPTLAIHFARDLALGIGAAVAAIINRFETARALSSYDSRMLADIGLRPEDVQSAFAEPIWRDPTRRLAVIAIERRTAAREARRADMAANQKTDELVH